MKTVIHVNQHNIRRNAKEGANDPVLTCKTYKDNSIGNTAILRDKDGREVGRFVYRPEQPLSCGARVWFETNMTVEVLQ
jgi:hypothetical protein